MTHILIMAQGEVRVLQFPSSEGADAAYTHVAVAGLGPRDPASNDGVDAVKDSIRTAVAGTL